MTTTKTRTAAATTAPTAPAAEPTVIHVDPATVAIAPNIRTVIEAEPGFIDSVKAAGRIHHPVLGIRLPDGSVHIIDGQMRTLAAQTLGLKKLPVYVTDGTQADLDSVTERTTLQLVSNDRRTALTVRDRIAATRALALDGMSVAEIARRTGTKRDQIKATLTVANSAHATEVAEVPGIDMLHAATIAEYEEHPDLQQRLTNAASYGPGQFEHEVERAKRTVTSRAEFQRIHAQYIADGVTVLDGDQANAGDLLRTLANPPQDGAKAVPLTEKEHAGCPGHALRLTHHDYSGTMIIPVCLDPRAHGHLNLLNAAEVAKGAPLSTEEADAITEAESETATLIRRRVKINNIDWAAATTVRREWLTEFVNRKKLPADALQFSLVALTRHSFEASRGSVGLAASMLGADRRNTLSSDAIADFVEANPTKVINATVAHALGRLEEATDGDTWRSGGKAHKEYLEKLATWGYTLSRVERVLLGDDDLTTYAKQ